ncbi:hypothetical protein PALB_220 [Pseudoalteromonas luteoviolacea B = ATCC 29581]|nr:hypothetical protein PALB_220 [Pseudoalteromonas luteoviolacea B = ATCC 29581]
MPTFLPILYFAISTPMVQSVDEQAQVIHSNTLVDLYPQGVCILVPELCKEDLNSQMSSKQV